MKKCTLTALAVMAALAYCRAQTAYSENFETINSPALPAGWSQTNAGSGNGVGWAGGDSASISSHYFTVPAHTLFAAVNDDTTHTADNSNSFIQSGTFSLAGFTAGTYLSFDLYYNGRDINNYSETLTLEISTNGGTTWTVLQTLPGNPVEEWETKHIDLSAYNGMSNLKLGWRYKDAGSWLMGAAIDNILVNVPPVNELALTGISPVAGALITYGTVGTGIAISGTVANQGTGTITSYTAHYQEGSAPAVTETINTTIAPYSNSSFSFSTMAPIAALGNNPVHVWVTLPGDADAANDSAATAFTGVSFMPAKKLVFEEGTGTWCGYCVRGIVYMDSIRTVYGNANSLIAVHDKDPMTIGNYDTTMVSLPGYPGFPFVQVDRRRAVDPSDLFTAYASDHALFGFADITLGTLAVNGNTITLPVNVTPAMDLNGDYRLAMVLTEDRVSGTDSGWAQHNYYSPGFGGFGPMQNAEYDFTALPSLIPAAQMHYDFVARKITTDPDGTPNSLPAVMTAGNTYSYTFTTTIDPSWNQNNMHAVVMLIRHADGQVLNSNNTGLPLAIANVTGNINKLLVFPNPAGNSTTAQVWLDKPATLAVQVTDMTGRSVYHTATTAAAGKTNIPLATGNFAEGLYHISVQSSNGTATQLLHVVH